MYGFLRERRWVLGLLVVVGVAAGCVRLGFWQLDRRQETAAARARTEERARMPVVPLDASVPPASASERRMEARGRYDAAHEIVLSNRSYREQPGRHLLTPLVLADGTAVIVDRGWIPLGTEPSEAPPPAGDVAVRGLVLPDEGRGIGGGRGVSADRLAVRIDVEAIRHSVPYPVYPLWLLIDEQEPPPGPLPEPVPRPDPEQPPHVSYAVQWFSFALTALVGFGALARREARERRRATEPARAGDDDEDDVAGHGAVRSPVP